MAKFHLLFQLKQGYLLNQILSGNEDLQWILHKYEAPLDLDLSQNFKLHQIKMYLTSTFCNKVSIIYRTATYVCNKQYSANYASAYRDRI